MRRLFGFAAGIALLASPFAAAQTPSLTFDVFAGSAGGSCSRDGSSSAARFGMPGGVAMDSLGNAYIADTKNHTIRKITPAGVVTTVAGAAGAGGYVNGTLIEARFNNPADVAVHPDGSIYVADSGNNVIRRISPTGVVSTVGPEPTANALAQPNGLAVDSAGNVFVADSGHHAIRKIAPGGALTTVAGTLNLRGALDGQGAAARFYYPYDVAIHSDGTLYVADYQNQTIRRIDSAGLVDTFAGLAGAGGSTDATGANARFLYPWGITVDGSGNVYVAEDDNHLVRRITPSRVVTTVAGVPATAGYLDGATLAGRFNRPRGVVAAADGSIWVSERGNQTVRRIQAGSVSTIAGLPADKGTTNGPRLDARFMTPAGVVVDSAGIVFVADSEDHTIRRIALDGTVTTFAGASGNPGLVNATGGDARFASPGDLAIDGSNTIYVADIGNGVIRSITPLGAVTTLATIPASIDRPAGLTVGPDGNVYAALSLTHQIVQVTPAGVVSVWAGTGFSGAADGPRLTATFSQPRDIAFDLAGNAYVTVATAIRKVSTAGAVTTIPSPPWPGWNSRPTLVVMDAYDNVVVADAFVLFTVDTESYLYTAAGSRFTSGTCSGTGQDARFESISGIASTSSGQIYLTDAVGHQVIRGVEPNQTIATATPQTTLPGGTIQLGAVPPSDSSDWKWSVVARPAKSVSALSSTSIIDPTFTLDEPGPYRVELRASSATGVRISNVDLVACTPLSSVTIEALGSTTTCRYGAIGSTRVRAIQDGNCVATYQWGFRTVPGGAITPLNWETASTYDLEAWQFPDGVSWLVVTATPAGGSAKVSNEIPITINERPSATITHPAAVGAYSKGNVVSIPDAGTGATYQWYVTNATIVAGQGTRELTFDAAVASITVSVYVTRDGCSNSAAAGIEVLPGPRFNLVTPCRIIDSRTSTPLAGDTTRTVIVAGKCGIPAGARAVTANITAVQPLTEGWFALYPAGSVWGGTSTMNYRAGKTRANNAVVPLSEDGGIEVRNGSTAATHFLIDVSGYFQ